MMKAKKGKMASDRDRRQKEITKKQNPISEYDEKGKLKYTAAKKGAMMNKSTRGYGAARTSGMGLQDEQDQVKYKKLSFRYCWKKKD
jgi:hypothetical protein